MFEKLNTVLSSHLCITSGSVHEHLLSHALTGAFKCKSVSRRTSAVTTGSALMLLLTR